MSTIIRSVPIAVVLLTGTSAVSMAATQNGYGYSNSDTSAPSWPPANFWQKFERGR